MQKSASHTNHRFVALLLAVLPTVFCLQATSLPPLTLERTLDEAGPFSRLRWTSEPGFLYRLQSAASLAASADGSETWLFAEALVADSTNAAVEIRGRSLPENSVEFYRLASPGPEILAVEPAWIDSTDPNAALHIVGQCLPTNATVRINGLDFPATVDGSGVLRASLVGGALPGGSIISSAVRVIDNNTGKVVATWDVISPLYYGAALTTEQLQGPPSEPPTSPLASTVPKPFVFGHGLIVVPSEKWVGDGKDDDCDNLPDDADQNPLGRSLGGGRPSFGWRDDGDRVFARTDSRLSIECIEIAHEGIEYGAWAGGAGGGVFPATGEFRCAETDLALPGRGLDFAWTRTYRSRTGPDTAQGAGWDFAYNVSLTQNGDGTLTLRPGNGRADTFYPDGTNGWIRDEYFCEVHDLNGDAQPDVLFADTGKWLFTPPGTPAAGKLWQIVDRNGNTMTLSYDTAGRLAEIVDDLGRTNSVAYNAAGRVESVTDFGGRVVRYEYNSDGDLTACISPATSDFPGGITNRYTYTSGQSDARLNHNLTACIDGKGQTCLQVIYQATTDPASPDFDAVAAILRGIEKKDIRRGMVIAKPSNRFAVTKVIECDALGNVTESYYDSRQRCVRLLEFTGRSDPALPVTDTENRPIGKLRTDDPDYFETQWEWNADSLCTLELRADGSRTESVHQRVKDHNSSRSNKTASRRHAGNVLVVRERAGSAGGGDLDGDGVPDFTELVWRYEYDARFGSSRLQFQPEGTKGVRIHGIHRGGMRVQDHNSSRSNKSSSKSSVQDHNSSRSNKTSSALDNGDNTPIIRGRTRLQFQPEGTKGVRLGIGVTAVGATFTQPPHADKIVPTVLNHAVNTKGTGAVIGRVAGGGKGFGKIGNFARSFTTRVTDPRGGTTTAEYDAQGNLVHTETTERKAGYIVAADIKHNARGQIIAITNAADAKGCRRVDRIEYYTNGLSAGRVSVIVVDDPGLQPRHAFEYDARGNLTRYVDPNTNDWLYAYDALDRCVTRQTPNNSFGERTTTSFTYDANGNVVQTSTGLRDERGTFLHDVVCRAEYDLLDRCTALAEQVSPGVFITNLFDYDANGNLVGVRSPLAVSGADPHARIAFEYDERDLLFREIAAPGSPLVATNEFAYDARGRVRVLRGPEYLRVITCAYDGLGRPSALTDPMGNVTSFNYDRNGNLTRVRHYGETNDVPGNAGNRLLAETRHDYDGLNRRVRVHAIHFGERTQLPIGDGEATITYAYAPNGACTGVTNDNNHATSFSYDTAGRLASAARRERKDMLQWFYDKAGNMISEVISNQPDGGGAAQMFTRSFSHDSLDRCVADWDNVGNTNRYAYDSLSRCVLATDPRGNDSVFAFDDLGRGHAATHFAGAEAGGITINTSHVEYDVNDRCVVATDGNTNTTGFVYDSLGNCTKVTRADGTVCSLVWSPRSNLLRVQDANGTIVSNRFDLLDRCERRDITPGPGVAASTTREAFGYDGISRLVAAANDASTNTFAYDSLGNCVKAIRDGWQMLALFDSSGNCLSLTYPSGRVVNYTYNEVDAVASVSTSAGGLPPVTLATFDYDGPGRVSRITRANGVDTRCQWDGLISPPNAAGDFGWGQISGISHRLTGGGTILDRRACAYDRNQNKTIRAQTTPFFTGGPTTTNLFGYNALDRLVGFSRGTGTPDDLLRTYQLDPNGNRQVVNANGLPQFYVMDAKNPPGDFQMNQYTATPFGTQKFDENGNLTTRGTALGAVQYIYDFADRLVAVNDLNTGLPVASYAYDALGRRIAKTRYSADPMTPPVTTKYLHAGRNEEDDFRDSIIEERDGDGSLTGEHFYAHLGSALGSGSNFGDTPGLNGSDMVASRVGGQMLYHHADDLGSALALTDAKGMVLERYDYDDYGQPTFQTSDGVPLTGGDGQPATSSAAGNAFLFHGLEWDAELGFYHAGGGGHFDPQAGQTTSAMKIDGGMPNRISMNVTVPKQTQGATFGERVNAGLAQAGSVVAQGASLLGNNPWTPRKGEGGRHTPFHNPYRPSLRDLQRGHDFTKHITLIK